MINNVDIIDFHKCLNFVENSFCEDFSENEKEKEINFGDVTIFYKYNLESLEESLIIKDIVIDNTSQKSLIKIVQDYLNNLKYE